MIFCQSDEGLVRFVEVLRARSLADPKVIVFTDTRDGLEQERKAVGYADGRDDVFMEAKLKTQVYRSMDHTSSGSIKEVFDTASQLAPMVLVIEDIDSMPEFCRSYLAHIG